jgi:hypothetical protein
MEINTEESEDLFFQDFEVFKVEKSECFILFYSYVFQFYFSNLWQCILYQL